MLGEFGFVLVLNINLPQVAYARLEGDYIVCAAYSHELPRYSDKFFFFCARPIGSVVEPVQSWPTPVPAPGVKICSAS